MGQPNTITILKCFSFDVCQIGGCFNPLFNLSFTVSKVSRFLLLRPCFSLFQIPSLIQLLFESSVTRKADSLLKLKAKLFIKISKITVIDGCHCVWHQTQVWVKLSGKSRGKFRSDWPPPLTPCPSKAHETELRAGNLSSTPGTEPHITLKTPDSITFYPVLHYLPDLEIH